jgi:hypothetical protein
MTTVKWATPEGEASALTTELNSLADGSYSSASSAIDNETDLYLYASFEVYLASLTPAADGEAILYLQYSLDGSNYEDQNERMAVGAIKLSTATAVKRHNVLNVPLSPLKFKVILKNDAGVALATSGNIVKYSRHNIQSA